MTITTQLYQGEQVYLGPIDFEKDPEIESNWTHNPAYLHSIGFDIALPMSVAKVKKHYEAIEKEVEESKNTFYFTIRQQGEDKLLGFIKFFWIEWTNATGGLQIGIGHPDERDAEYVHEASKLALNFAFRELNLYRLSVFAADNDPPGVKLLEKHGFVEEVRRRKALQRNGKFCDSLLFGLMQSEWLAQQGNQDDDK